MKKAVLLAVFCLAHGALSAEEFVKGSIQDKVVCRDDPSESYALYIPSGYNPARKWPILYAFDPGGRAREPLTRFKDAAEARGFIVACSYNSRNGPWEPIFKSAAAVWTDTHARLAVDDERVFAAGFSGGARAASVFSKMIGRPVAGVIACGAGIPESMGIDKLDPMAFCGIVGTADFNYREIVELNGLLDRRADIAHWIRTFDGTHSWPPVPVCTEAMEWLELVSAKRAGLAPDRPLADALIAKTASRAAGLEKEGAIFRAATELDAAVSAFSGLGDTSGLAADAARLRGTDVFKRSARKEAEQGRKEDALLTELYGALTAIETTVVLRRDLGEFYSKIDRLVDSARKAPDATDKEFARRVLLAVSVQAAERGGRFLEEKAPAKGVLCFEIAVRASEYDDARRAVMLYNVACAHARAGNRRPALESLRRAVASGFSNKALLLEDSDLASVRDTPEFREILAGL
jgi:hypothetical protein